MANSNFNLIGSSFVFHFLEKREKEIPKVYVAPIKEALSTLKGLDEKHCFNKIKLNLLFRTN